MPETLLWSIAETARHILAHVARAVHHLTDVRGGQAGCVGELTLKAVAGQQALQIFSANLAHLSHVSHDSACYQ